MATDNTLNRTNRLVLRSTASAFLLFLFVTFPFAKASAQTAARAVTGIITDYNGFWQSTAASPSDTKPDNSHHLLAFTYGSNRYSTGVDDTKLTDRGITFNAGKYLALPQFNVTGKITSNTKVGLGQLYDKVDNGKSTPSPDGNINKYLQDGIQGLDLGTGVANLPSGLLEFSMTNILASAVGDGVPDFIVTQIADPSGSRDEYEFLDENNLLVGRRVTILFTDIPSVGKWTADFYEANTNPMTLTSGFVKTDRDIRLWAGDFSDFGITKENVSQVKSFKVILSGNSDVAFVAYNANSFINQSPVAPLPITLSSLQAQHKQNTVAVTWETASEENSSHFEVEASLDGKTFEKYGEVAAAGNSNVKQRYTYKFTPRQHSMYYIRLKQVDLNGSFEYSRTVSVTASAQEQLLNVYPNPATNALVQVQHPVATGYESITVYSLSGKQLVNAIPESGSSATALKIGALSKGMYQVVWQSDGAVQTTKLLVR